ncbi:MAG TPA: secretin N-terminal domain-containing protein [Sedimentisphaerales bacterium]|nr:secretin N-terminal domain-containing protein [Sedimentisphaerales bacterium]
MRSFLIKISRLWLSAACAGICVCGTVARAGQGNEPAPQTEQTMQAEQPVPTEQAAPSEPTDKKETKEVMTDLERRMQKVVCIDVNEVQIGTVIRQLADQVDVDLIMSPKVTGNVTVSLTEVSLEEALRSILDVHGAAYIPGKNIIRIVPREELPEINERLVTETFEIIYADVTQVVKALDKFKSAQGSVSSIEGTSHIIVTDTESKTREVAALLEKIDRIIPQVLVEVRIYDITSKDNLDFGIEWRGARRTNFDSGNLIINDDITVKEGGADTYVSSRTDPAVIAGFEGGTSKTADATLGFLRFGVLNNHLNVDAILRAEKENINAKLLANPRILVLDNEEATFDIVTEQPYVEKTITSGTVTESVKFKPVGVKLVVKPHVARDGMLRLTIAPEFSVLVERVTVSSSNIPVVDTRKVKTVALVKDGQAVVLGGLRKKETSQQVNKVPVLGDIPILGHLFRFEGEATVNTELVVFITPRIIMDPSLSESELEALEVTKFSGPRPATTKAEAAMK